MTRPITKREDDCMFAGSARAMVDLTAGLSERSPYARALLEALSPAQRGLVIQLLATSYQQGVVDALDLDPTSLFNRGYVAVRSESGDVVEQLLLIQKPLTGLTEREIETHSMVGALLTTVATVPIPVEEEGPNTSAQRMLAGVCIMCGGASTQSTCERCTAALQGKGPEAQAIVQRMIERVKAGEGPDALADAAQEMRDLARDGQEDHRN